MFLSNYLRCNDESDKIIVYFFKVYALTVLIFGLFFSISFTTSALDFDSAPLEIMFGFFSRIMFGFFSRTFFYACTKCHFSFEISDKVVTVNGKREFG